MPKYIITYRLTSDPEENNPQPEYSYNQRRNELLGCLEEIHYNDTTSTIAGRSDKKITELGEEIIKKCKLLQEDNLLIFSIKDNYFEFSGDKGIIVIGKIQNKQFSADIDLMKYLFT